MLKLHARRLLFRFTLIIVLAAALVATSPKSARQKAAALTPCETCQTNFNNCVAHCNLSSDPTFCLAGCRAQLRACNSINHCS